MCGKQIAAADAWVPTKYTLFIDEPLCRTAKGGGLALLTGSVDVELRNREEGLWSVTVSGRVLNRDGEPEYEPLPSGRDDAFLSRTRFPLEGAEGALALARAFIGRHERYEP